MKVVVSLDLPEKLYEQLKQAASEQPHLDGIEDLAIACLEDAMEEREEFLREFNREASGDRSGPPRADTPDQSARD